MDIVVWTYEELADDGLGLGGHGGAKAGDEVHQSAQQDGGAAGLGGRQKRRRHRLEDPAEPLCQVQVLVEGEGHQAEGQVHTVHQQHLQREGAV